MVLRSVVRHLCIAAAGLLMAVQTAGSAAANAPPIWTGVYAGIHGGYAWADVDYTFEFFAGDDFINHSMSGRAIGGHVGVQRQFNNIVAGVEVSYTDLDLSDTVESTLIPNRFRHIEIDSLLLVTARLGYATERWMAYLKGGYASAQVDTLVYAGGGGAGSATSDTVSGWTIGAGLELLCWRNFRLGMEYNYVHLNLGGRSGQLPDYKPFEYRDFDDDIHMVTLRLSYLVGPRYVEPLK
jgi:outer membrane immunogenic protein